MLKNFDLISTSKDEKRKTVKKNNWDKFLIDQRIGDGVYFDRMLVSSFPTYNNKGATKDKYNNMWIGLGEIKGEPYTPSSQFKRFLSPPRRTKTMNMLIKKLVEFIWFNFNFFSVLKKLFKHFNYR